MANKIISDLPQAAEPLLGTDLAVVSRNGSTLTKVELSKLPLKTINGNTLIGSGNIAVSTTTNLGTTTTTTSATITNTAGTTATIPSATKTAAGVMSAADKEKLDTNVSRIYPASWRNIASRTGWPNAKLDGQCIGCSYHTNFDDMLTSVKLVYVGAYLYTEVATTGSPTYQAKIEYPVGSGNFTTVTFGGLVEGIMPASPRILESDAVALAVPIPRGAEFRVFTSGNGQVAVCHGGSFLGFNSDLKDINIQNANTTDVTAMQLQYLTNAQLTSMSMRPITKFTTGATWAAGTVTLSCPGHQRATSTNSRVIIRGMTPAALNGTYSYSLSGSHAITYSLASDPGTFVSGGTAQFVSVAGTSTWSSANGGTVTVPATAHGYLTGQKITIGGASPVGYNGIYEITAVDANTFTYPLATNPGTMGVACYHFNTLVIGTNANAGSFQYHLRPAAILGNSTIESPAVLGDSTSTSGAVDFVSDNTLVSGVGERCIGKAFPTLNVSASNDRLQFYVTNAATDHAIRIELMNRYATNLIFALQKNDIPLYTTSTISTLFDYYDSLWEAEPFDRFALTGKNKVALIASGTTTSKDQFTTLHGQTRGTTDDVRVLFNARLKQDYGSKYNMVFDIEQAYGIPGFPAIMKVDEQARTILVTVAAGGSLVTVDASTPIYPSDNGKKIAIPGAGSSGDNVIYAYIKYVSATSFILTGTTPYTIAVVTNAITSGAAILGARLMVASSSSLANTIHESKYAFDEISRTIGLPSPFNIV